MGYDSLNNPLMRLIPINSKFILDLGCGEGNLGEALESNFDCHVTGVTYDQNEYERAKSRISDVIVADLNTIDFDKNKKYDCIICSHSLEHLYEPQQLLQKCRSILNQEGVIVIALPNVLFWQQRIQFIKGNFKYSDGGIMDRTHFRFYDWESAHELFKSADFVVDYSESTAHVPGSKYLGQSLGGFSNRLAGRYFPGLFGWQFLFRCRKA